MNIRSPFRDYFFGVEFLLSRLYCQPIYFSIIISLIYIRVLIQFIRTQHKNKQYWLRKGKKVLFLTLFQCCRPTDNLFTLSLFIQRMWMLLQKERRRGEEEDYWKTYKRIYGSNQVCLCPVFFFYRNAFFSISKWKTGSMLYHEAGNARCWSSSREKKSKLIIRIRIITVIPVWSEIVIVTNFWDAVRFS